MCDEMIYDDNDEMLKDSTRSGDELEEVVEACSSKRLDGVLLDVHHRLAEVRDDYIVAAAADDAADGVLLPHHGHHHELDAVGEVAIAAFGRVEEVRGVFEGPLREGAPQRVGELAAEDLDLLLAMAAGNSRNGPLRRLVRGDLRCSCPQA